MVGYPKLLDETGKGSLYSKEEARAINSCVTTVNKEISKLVDSLKAEGMNICYVGVSSEFEGHGAYSDDPYIHPVILLAGKQDLVSSALINSASIHPNAKGAEAIARCVQYAIDRLEAGSRRYIFDYFAEED